MMKSVLLFCALGTTQPDCSIDTAISVIQGPDASDRAQCEVLGEAYLANTAFASYLNSGYYLKVLCIGDNQMVATVASD